MIIPVHSLSDEALENLIKEYCLRDWGLNEVESPLADHMEQVRKAVKDGQLLVLYSEHFETAQLVAADEARGLV